VAAGGARAAAGDAIEREEQVSEALPFKYLAFLSYSHRDKAWGKWLHAALEGYRVDKDLVGRDTPTGSVPKTLRPIFRDREDFSAGHSLTEQTIAALEASNFLIVICSPSAAQSKYVNEEVRRFKMLTRGERVIPVIVGGEPGDPAHECFPPSLRYKVETDGHITGEREEPIAADARPQGDGKEIAKQKVVAGLIGLGLDEIVRRAERARRRRNRFWVALAGVFLLFAVAASGSAAYAWQQLKTNEAFLNATLKRATDIIDEAVAQAEKYNVPRAATLSLLIKAEGLFDDMAQFGRPTPELRYRKALMLIQFARNYQILGDTDKQFARANEAYRLLAGLAAEKPDDATYQHDLSSAYTEVGDVLKARGNLSEALQAYRDGLAKIERLAEAYPSYAALQRDLSVSQGRVGDVLVAQGNLTEALQAYRDGLAITTRLTKDYPGNVGLQRDLSLSLDKVGYVAALQGNLTEALRAYRDSLAIRERLAKTDPGNAGWQRDLSASYNNVGDLMTAQGNLAEALRAHREGLAIRERLAKADPSNADWQSDLTVSQDKVGDVLVAQGNLTEALQAYRDGLAITERLAKADPGNADWQSNLSLSYERIGLAAVLQGNLSEALQAYRESLAIRERLAKVDPSNADWQRNLSVCYAGIGNVLLVQGNLTEARQAYRESLAITERLAKADPGNAAWQRDLAIGYSRFALVHLKRGEVAEASVEFGKGREIMTQLVAVAPSNSQWRKDLAWFDGQIVALDARSQEAGRK
jgi:tetratricopeptide (TPR) repeat protein